MASDFSAVVRDDRGNGVQGVRVLLETDPYGPVSKKDAPSVRIATVVTDQNGVAAFSNVKAGKYYVTVDHSFLQRSEWVEVLPKVRNKKAATAIEMSWPLGVVTARSVAGSLQAPRNTGDALMDKASPQVALVTGAKLRIAELLTDRTLGASQTGDDGSFYIPGLPPGLYVLHIERAGDSLFRSLKEDVPFRVDSSSSSLVVSLKMGNVICGG